uniref:Uncharacterized protein n=1 Tax=Aegilops tauschii subsp. strangulata TaxID=200361 RepID=A0A453NR40_AEGTS
NDTNYDSTRVLRTESDQLIFLLAAAAAHSLLAPSPTGEAICRTPKNFRTFSKQASTPLDYSLETLDPQTHAATSSWIIHGASQPAPATTSAPSAPRPTSPFARLRLSRPTPFPTI